MNNMLFKYNIIDVFLLCVILWVFCLFVGVLIFVATR